MDNESDSVGREVPKDYRAVIEHLVAAQGWRYDNGRSRGGHPTLKPADRRQPVIAVPTTPGDHRSFKNFISLVRRCGGVWPPPRKA